VIVSLVVALDPRGVIGRGGDLPWRLPADLRRFKAITAGHVVLMGRRCHESIGRALPERTNLVLSRDPAAAGRYGAAVEVLPDLRAALARARAAGETELMVIGGADVYAAALPLASRLYVTEVAAEVEGDVVFPAWDRSEWREHSREHHPADERHAHAFDFVVYERGAAPAAAQGSDSKMT
jgi:dihydrofolate reductase